MPSLIFSVDPNIYTFMGVEILYQIFSLPYLLFHFLRRSKHIYFHRSWNTLSNLSFTVSLVSFPLKQLMTHFFIMVQPRQWWVFALAGWSNKSFEGLRECFVWLDFTQIEQTKTTNYVHDLLSYKFKLLGYA